MTSACWHRDQRTQAHFAIWKGPGTMCLKSVLQWTDLDGFAASFAVVKRWCKHSTRYCFSPPSSLSFMTNAKPLPFTVVVPWLPSSSWSLKHCRDVVWWIVSLFLSGLGSVWDCRLFSPNLTLGCVFCKSLCTCVRIAVYVYINMNSSHSVLAFHSPLTFILSPSFYPFFFLYHSCCSPFILLVSSFSLLIFSHTLTLSQLICRWLFFSPHLPLTLVCTFNCSLHP